MQINSIKFKNFNSYGDELIELKFGKESSLNLLKGLNGSGKCLSKDTEIEIHILDPILKEKFLIFLKKNNKKLKCTLKDLYEFNKLNNSISNGSGDFMVKTKFGNKAIKNIAITAINSIQYKITTETGKSIISSPDHLFYYEGWKKTKLFTKGDFIETKEGLEKIIDIEILKEKADLFDIEVEEVKEFYANDFRSHNSTISNILCFGLYGKVAGKNKTDLPNRTNDNLYVEVDLFSCNKKVTIKRGINPNLFEIIVDGENKDEGKIDNMQNYLNDEILNIPFTVFNNMLVLSINNFKSFLTMSPKQKKLIIDKIFGFGVLNAIKKDVKEERKLNKKQIDDIESSVITLKRTLDEINEKIENQKQLNTDKIIEFEQNKAEIEIELIDKKSKLQLLKDKLTKLKQNKKEKNDNFVINNTVLKTLKSTLDVYNKGKCPLCLNDLSHNHDIFETVEEEYIDTNEQLISLKKDLDFLNSNIEKCNLYINQLTKEINSHINQISIYNNKIQELNYKEKSNLNELHEDILSQLLNKKSQLNDLKIEDNFLYTFLQFVGDDGIKKMALSTVIPSLNEQIVKMCNDMHLNYIVQFDTNFNSQIYTTKKTEVSPKSLSTGQKKVIDFICVISLLKVLKIRFPSINILFLDEIFSSIDSDRIYEITKALRRLTTEMHLHVFVVNHANLPSEYFDMIYETKIENGFSVINKSET